jgi:hypothetical protein
MPFPFSRFVTLLGNGPSCQVANVGIESEPAILASVTILASVRGVPLELLERRDHTVWATHDLGSGQQVAQLSPKPCDNGRFYLSITSDRDSVVRDASPTWDRHERLRTASVNK